MSIYLHPFPGGSQDCLTAFHVPGDTCALIDVPGDNVRRTFFRIAELCILMLSENLGQSCSDILRRF